MSCLYRQIELRAPWLLIAANDACPSCPRSRPLVTTVAATAAVFAQPGLQMDNWAIADLPTSISWNESWQFCFQDKITLVTLHKLGPGFDTLIILSAVPHVITSLSHSDMTQCSSTSTLFTRGKDDITTLLHDTNTIYIKWKNWEQNDIYILDILDSR